MTSRELEARARRWVGWRSSSSSKCQDCGNQAKKDCPYLRCRTCCKNRAFQCQTHVRSTWVPVSLRHIQPQTPASAAGQHRLPQAPNPKRHCRQVPASGLQEENFPRELSIPAAFRCVRVSSMDNVVDQYAYQTSVSIGGHVFTGILYDQGPEPEEPENYVTGESSSAGLLRQPTVVSSTSATATGTTPATYTSPLCALSSTTSQLFHYPKG